MRWSRAKKEERSSSDSDADCSELTNSRGLTELPIPGEVLRIKMIVNTLITQIKLDQLN